ncbi:MAG: DUF433 domain-containing protein [Candidatus Manganitrophaceae bacterium]|nr:MAG: DUF433 domain-containing protein [Candidatus Manganitrophaceae bacterium]
MAVDWRDHILSTPEVLRGKRRIRATRIPVSLILGYLAMGKSHEEIIKDCPDLTKGRITAFLFQGRGRGHS